MAASKKPKKPAVDTPRARMTLEEFDVRHATAVVNVREMAQDSGYRSTGSLRIDDLLGGGLPKGGMTELWGPPQSGKSTVAIRAAGQCLAEGGRVAYADLERGLDLVNEAEFLKDLDDNTLAERLRNLSPEEQEQRANRRTSWLRTNGVDVFSPNFRILDPEHGENLFEILDDIVRYDLFDMVIVDSVAAIITRAEMEGNPGESHFGQVAKLLAVELKRLLRLYSGNRNTSIIWINQARDKIGFMAKGQKSTGGHALEHYVGTKLEFRKIARVESDDDVVTESILKLNKSRYASARSLHIFVSGKRGLDTLREVMEYALDFGLIHKSGAWFYIFEEPLESDTFVNAKDKSKLPGLCMRVQGEENALDWLAEHDWEARLQQLAQKSMGKR